MAQAILLRGGAGGVTSDDVTASKAQVLQGYRTVTRDSDDEVVEGTFPVTSDADAKQEFWYYNDHGNDAYVTRIPEAAYKRYYNQDGSQGWDPWVRISRSLVKSGINYHPEATLENTNTCGEQGRIKVVDTKTNNYSANQAKNYGIDGSRNKFWMLLGHGNAYYCREDNNPHVELNAELLGDATASDIVSTKKATSRNGIAIQGTLPYKGNGGKPNGVVCPEMWYYGNENCYVTRFDAGAYYNVENYKPYVSVPVELVKQAVNYHPKATLSNTVTCNERGQIKMVDTKLNNYTNNQAKNIGIDSSRGKLWMELGHGNAYYYRDDNSPHVEVDAARLGTAGADSVLSGQTASSQYGINFQGTIPRWICGTGDVISAVNNEGFAWDDTYAGRGRGIVVKIPNKHFIQDANYAFLASPNLYPQNIRAGVNINGVTGTMPDYSTGRTVFNGATFDGTLLLGVADKDFYVGGDYYALDLAGNYKYSGIYNGGINLSLSTAMPSIRGRYIGCIISQSVNLTPFNRIDVYWRVIGDIKNDAYIDFAAGISKSSTLVRGGMVIGSNPKDGFTGQAVQDIASGPQITKSGKLELYVGGINEQGFLYFYASTNISSGRDAFTGSIQITKIDFLN